MIVVTDGNDVSSSRSLEACAEQIYNKYTRDSSNFLFLLGVGDDFNSTKLEQVIYIYKLFKYYALNVKMRVFFCFTNNSLHELDGEQGQIYVHTSQGLLPA
jgi:hypothetical protein